MLQGARWLRSLGGPDSQPAIVPPLSRRPIAFPSRADGPYGLAVHSDRGLRVGAVFTVGPGEAVRFDCSADSNPPNVYSWMRRGDNSTQVIEHGPRLEVAPGSLGRSTDYVCCAYNNVTGRRGEARVTVVITSLGLEKISGKGTSSLAVLTGLSLFLIVAVSLLLAWQKWRPHTDSGRRLGGRPDAEYRAAQTRSGDPRGPRRSCSGHEDAPDDFGIYEFVTFPEPATVPRMPGGGSEQGPGQEVRGTIYEVIRHIPGQEQRGRAEEV
ncbi:HEPACAM family member 2 [Monodelphis domestica]|uniref:HEPACAM family member 2 n=1 Tax=Monodelphis domestica TaxID=13616 RepID=UPI0024E25A46|nr:HEPACAM family member 2 [Monodelphis domestica]